MQSSRAAKTRTGKRHQQGVALLIMLVLAVMGSLFAVTSQLEFVTRKFARGDETFKALTLAKQALIGYALTYRDDPSHPDDVLGYLPCPDQTGNGVATYNCANAGIAAVGLLPYKTLGLPDLRDADGNCLWYAVSGTFKNDQMAYLTPPPDPTVMNWDTQGQFSISGTSVAPEQGDGGAVAVIFAPGPPLSGQSRTVFGSEACKADPSEIAAYLDGGYTLNAFAVSTAIAIVPGVVKDANDNITNNDQVAFITPREIFDKVVKRTDFSNALTATPPGQINTLTDIIQAALEKKIQDDLLNSTNTSQPLTAGFTQFGKQIGRLPATATDLQATPLYDNYTSAKINYSAFYNNWAEQYRLVTCPSLASPCLTMSGATSNCRGALMFPGRSDTANGYAAAGQPRLSAHKAASSDYLGKYFEVGSGLDILNNDIATVPAGTTFSGNTSFSAATPSADVGTCLFPGTFLSSALDIAGFAGGVILPTASNPVVAVSGSAIGLGSVFASSTQARSGCVWYQTPFALGTFLRLYFSFVAVTAGQGFTVALADAATNNIASTAPYMCGSTTNSRLGYAGRPTGGTSAGIKPPKIGVEFDTAVTANRNDYSGDHFAFLYWGSAGDNSPTGTVSGNDDNTHYRGILGSGAEPLNPYGLSVTTASATPIATLSAASWAGGTVTATTSAPHGFSTGQYVLIADVTSTGYDPASSTPVAVTVTDSNHFTYALASNPGAYTYGTTASRTAKTTAAGVSCSSGTVTVNTVTNHGFAANQFVNISGITPVGYNGTFQIASVASATRFTYALGASCPSTSSVAGFVTATNDVVSAAWSAGTVTVTTGTSHGLGRQITAANWVAATNTTTITTASVHDYVTGQTVTIAGTSPAIYSGTYTIASVPDATSFTVTQNLTGVVSPNGDQVASAAWSLALGTTTVTTASDHTHLVGETVTISGLAPTISSAGSYTITAVTPNTFTFAQTSGGWASDPSNGERLSISGIYPTGYNGTFLVKEVISATQFTYALASNPGASFTNATFAPSGFSTVRSPYFPAGGSIPASPSVIHVRLDLSRSYSASAKQATVTLKAYMDNLFPVASVCSETDFQNLSRDLSFLCPSRTPTIEQDGVVINDVNGPALANIYIGFTTARGTSTADNQDISISNILLRSQ